MAAYAVKMLPIVAGVVTLGSGTLAFASWHRAYELEERVKKFLTEKAQWERDLYTLRKTIDWERHMKEEKEKELAEANESLKNQSSWRTIAVGTGLGCLAGYVMR
jgi:ElaB/YqjD/DUF883 family membrane-anchored ribosome-binding protein